MDEKSGYNAPPPAYSQVQGGAPQPYGAGQGGYGPTQPAYAPPPAGYGPPPAGYPPPQAGYAPPPQGYAPPPAGYGAQPQGYAPQGYPSPGAPVTVAVGQPQPMTNVVVVRGTGNCPHCRQGNMVEDFTVCGIILAILFFPLGVLCCLLMRQRYCNVCGHRVG